MTRQDGGMRIWYQSFIDVEAQAPYFKRLRDYIDSVKAPGTTIDVHGIFPPDRFFHPITEFRCAEQTIRNALKAREEGYDAFVIGHFQEPGLHECRGAVDIPVIGLGEAIMHFSCMLGRRIGLITIDPVFIPYHEAQVIGHGLQHRVTGIRAFVADLDRFMRAFEDQEARAGLAADFEAQARPLVAAGADVIVPAGGMPMLLFSQMQPYTIDGAAVIDGISTVTKMAEMAVTLYRITGISAGRNGYYQLAPQGAINDFLGISREMKVQA